MKCKICHNEKDNKVFEVREMMFDLRETFRYFQCSSCQCLQIETIPQNISMHYPDNYYSFNDLIKPQNRFRSLPGRLRDRYAVWNNGLVGRLIYARYPNYTLRALNELSINKDTSILDIGCGTGRSVYSLRELGLKKLLGIDPYISSDIKYNNGVVIQKKEIREVDGKWDVVMLHHTFEHIANPLENLQLIANLMTSKGHCIIRIPVVPSYAWEHYGVNWVQLDAPRHFFLHSVKSMNILADQCGLEVRNVIYDSTAFQFWGSEQYVRDIALKNERSYSVNADGSIFTSKDISNFTKRAKELNATNQGDQAIFYISKSQEIRTS